jgi:hypothetical protein
MEVQLEVTPEIENIFLVTTDGLDLVEKLRSATATAQGLLSDPSREATTTTRTTEGSAVRRPGQPSRATNNTIKTPIAKNDALMVPKSLLEVTLSVADIMAALAATASGRPLLPSLYSIAKHLQRVNAGLSLAQLLYLCPMLSKAASDLPGQSGHTDRSIDDTAEKYGGLHVATEN